MRNFKEIIGEVKGILKGAAILNTLQNVALLFLSMYLLFALFNLFPFAIASIISFFYLLSTWIKKTDVYTAKLVEKRFPFLKDKLTTAADTLNQENFVVNRLRVEVAKRLNDVDASSFFNIGKIIVKSGSILVVIFMLMFVTAIDFKIFDVRQALSGINIGFPNAPEFGDRKAGGNDLELSDDGLKFHVPKTVDITDLQDVQDTSFKKEEFLSYDELIAIGAKDYEDPITEEEKEVVKNYFNRINKR